MQDMPGQDPRATDSAQRGQEAPGSVQGMPCTHRRSRSPLLELSRGAQRQAEREDQAEARGWDLRPMPQTNPKLALQVMRDRRKQDHRSKTKGKAMTQEDEGPKPQHSGYQQVEVGFDVQMVGSKPANQREFELAMKAAVQAMVSYLQVGEDLRLVKGVAIDLGHVAIIFKPRGQFIDKTKGGMPVTSPMTFDGKKVTLVVADEATRLRMREQGLTDMNPSNLKPPKVDLAGDEPGLGVDNRTG